MLHVLIVSILDAPFLKKAESLPFCEDGLKGDVSDGVAGVCPCDELLFVAALPDAAAAAADDDDEGPTDRSPGNVVGCLYVFTSVPECTALLLSLIDGASCNESSGN